MSYFPFCRHLGTGLLHTNLTNKTLYISVSGTTTVIILILPAVILAPVKLIHEILRSGSFLIVSISTAISEQVSRKLNRTSILPGENNSHLNTGSVNHFSGWITLSMNLWKMNFPSGTVINCARGFTIRNCVPANLKKLPAYSEILGRVASGRRSSRSF